jgi:hypothetical protein
MSVPKWLIFLSITCLALVASVSGAVASNSEVSRRTCLSRTQKNILTTQIDTDELTNLLSDHVNAERRIHEAESGGTWFVAVGELLLLVPMI